jgi:hypothetical protein
MYLKKFLKAIKSSILVLNSDNLRVLDGEPEDWVELPTGTRWALPWKLR